MKKFFAATVMAGAVLVCGPWLLSEFWQSLLLTCMMYVALAVSWSMFCGATRYLSLATSALFGLGSYTTALALPHLPWPLLIIAGGLVAALFALLAGTMSGSEQQMVAVGRALMGKPKYMLLDEPSLGLAPLMVAELFRILRRICEAGTGILLVEQNVRQALNVCDYAYILEQGQVVAAGAGTELLQGERIRKSYLGL